MKDIFDAEKRYENTLLEAKNFLNKKLKKPNGSSLNKERIDYLLSKNAECPICGIELEGANHNTEHIVPLTIGGKNILENKIQMCVICNYSRNQVMQALFPRPPLHKYYPEKWIDMKQFILWCELSIDEKELAADLIPSIHAKFMGYRTGGAEFPIQAKNSFGRESTWKVGDEPNYSFNQLLNNKKPISTSTNSKTSRSLALRFFDTIFGYEPNKENIPTQRTSIDDVKPMASTGMKRTTSIKQAINYPLKKLPDGVNKEAFIHAITELISYDEVSSNIIGNRIRKMQEDTGCDEVGTRPFLQNYGFSKSFGLVNAIKSCFGDQILIEGDGSCQRIRIIFPIVSGLNTKGKGLALPKDPEDFAKVLSQYCINQNKFELYSDVHDFFSEMMSKRKTNSTMTKLCLLLLPGNIEGPWREIDWKTAIKIEKASDLAMMIWEQSLERETDEEGNNINFLNKYFEQVIKHLNEEE